MAVRITIGDQEYEIGDINFMATERSWPWIEKAMMANAVTEPMAGVSAGLMVLASCLMEESYFTRDHFGIGDDEVLGDSQLHQRVGLSLKRSLKTRQIHQVAEALNAILIEAGLMPAEGSKPGEPEAVEKEASPSTETAPDTSLS